MKKLKVVTIVGTRPEIIRLSRLIPKLDEYTDHILVHTGQNYDHQLSDVFFEELEIRRPDYYLNVDTSSFGAVMGDTLKKSEEVLLKEKPDAVMILGDTNSAIAAIVAERLHIPVYHMEAGNRSFDKNVPEELNRRIVDHVSTFNLVYSEHARRNLIAEGINPRFIQKTGSPMMEIARDFEKKIKESRALETLGLETAGYFMASLHRQENVDSPARLTSAVSSLKALHTEYELPIILSTHPRTKSRLDELGIGHIAGVVFHPPFSFFDYNKLQIESKCVVSDSGSISEEAAVLGFKAVTLRSSMERPEALETGSIIMSDLDPDQIIRSVALALDTGTPKLPDDYSSPDFSHRVVGFLTSTASLAKEWQAVRGSSS